jgi:hypothetical protein
VIVSFNFYYARPGVADAVLRQRLLACDVREKLDVPRGRVWMRREGGEDLPDVIWELQFEDVAGHLADMAVRAASADFEAVRAGMRKLCRRFERPLFDIRDGAASHAIAPAAQCDFATLDWVYPALDADLRTGDILQAQLTSDDAKRACSSQLLRLVTPGDDLPVWVLKREYVNAAVGQRAPQPRSCGDDALAGIAGRIEHSAWARA